MTIFNALGAVTTVADLKDKDPLTLLVDWDDWIRRVGVVTANITVTGGVPRDSVLGKLVRLHWAEASVECGTECWDLHCPTPDKHAYRFRLTSQGRTHAERLRGEDV